jgi:hypothetical protein
VPPHQPQAALYVTRNLGTMLEDLEPGEFRHRISGGGDIEAYPLAGPRGRVLALWQPGRPHDACDGVRVDVWVEAPSTEVTGYEPLNGTMQTLTSESRDGGTMVKGVLVRDWPLLLRFS